MEKYFAQQEGYEAWSNLLKKPAWRARVTEEASFSQTEVFSEKVIVAWARNVVFRTLQSRGTTCHLNAVVAMIKRFVLLHPEYNSHRGFKQLSDDPGFAEVAGLECNAILNSTQG